MIPPEANAEFVCQMEETLNVYQRPPDPMRPLVCLDEASKQLVDHVTVPLEATPDHPTRIIDYEYTRNGTANIFMLSAPLEGRREALVTGVEDHHAIAGIFCADRIRGVGVVPAQGAHVVEQ